MLIDSGTEISVLHKSVVPQEFHYPSSKIKLCSAFGEVVVAPLINVPLRLIEKSGNCADVEVTCAMTDRLANNLKGLISPVDLKELQNALLTQEEAETAIETIAEGAIGSGEVEQNLIDLEVERVIAIINAETVSKDVNRVNRDRPDQNIQEEAVKFRMEQRGDTSLQECWEQAERGTNGMFVSDGLLFHQEHILGRQARQLVLPKIRREEVLSLAHDFPGGGHLGAKKTLQRIRESFFWPRMTDDTRKYVQSCHACQVRAPKKTLDRTPITPLTRPEEPFQLVNMDIIGPLDPPSSRGHKYALCLIDACTRWPEVVCLRSLTAKATCDAIIETCARVGIIREITSDQGTNFTAQLTQMLAEKLGTQIRFSAPDHPQSNGLVERWNGTFKRMLAHVIRDHGRDWDRFVPFLLWAYRSVPNATTGISPFEMLYARPPTGPLTILQTSWTGHTIPPVGLNTSTTEYLETIRDRMREVSELAREMAERKQPEYAHYYNLRARAKSFEAGESVLVEKVHASSKMEDKWEGPVIIAEKIRPGSYMVEYPDGKRRWVHANHLRSYARRATINAIGVTFDEDEEFGEVICAPVGNRVNGERGSQSKRPDRPLGLENESQRNDITRIINKYQDVFLDTPGRCKIGSHKITLTEGFRPKASRPSRIPIALRKEVDKQIDEMLRADLIEPAVSEFAYPIVCVAKRDGSIRICVDYRQLNSGTLPDAYPMANTEELISKVARANFISLIDLTRGYYQIKMDTACQHMTTFVTHEGMYSFKVMPFGLRNAAATFCRIINTILAPHKGYAEAYIDDIAVFSATWSEHLIHIEKVLETLRANGLTANLAKCQFGKTETVYLGHLIGSGRHAPDPTRVEAIKELQRPKTKRQLRSFLGISGYYRNYIEKYATIARPLTDLTARRVPNALPWNEQAENAFQVIKESLARIPFLYAPDPASTYILFTDASAWAVGACLAQRGPEGEERPVAFISKKLSGAQTRWSAIEREAYAVIWALGRFDTWIFGSQVEVISDHNPLSFLTSASPRGAKLARWALALQRYDVTIRHRSGKAHGNADALSRLGVHESDANDSAPEPESGSETVKNCV